MTILNWCGLINFLIILIVGSILKIRTRRKIRGIEGFGGVIKHHKEYKSGKIVRSFGE